MKLNYLTMLEDICTLVETEFCEDMCARKSIGKYDALKLAKVVGRVYLIAHGIHCGGCGGKYQTKEDLTL